VGLTSVDGGEDAGDCAEAGAGDNASFGLGADGGAGAGVVASGADGVADTGAALMGALLTGDALRSSFFGTSGDDDCAVGFRSTFFSGRNDDECGADGIDEASVRAGVCVRAGARAVMGEAGRYT